MREREPTGNLNSKHLPGIRAREDLNNITSVGTLRTEEA